MSEREEMGPNALWRDGSQVDMCTVQPYSQEAGNRDADTGRWWRWL